MTIKDLKQVISTLPDDGEVYVERIEDRYFEGDRPWPVKIMIGEVGEEQYIDTWCAINYDGKNLYLTSHQN